MDDEEVVKKEEVAQPKPSERWLQKLKERKPDLDYDNDPEAVYAALDDYDAEKDGKIGKYEESQKKLNDILVKDPKFSRALYDASNGENPSLALVRHYGKEALMAADDPETAESFVAAQQEYMDNMSKDKQIEEQQLANMEASLAVLENFAAENGMTEQEAEEFSNDLFQLADDIFMCKFTPEMLAREYLGKHHGEDVKDAYDMGKVDAANTKIRTESKDKVGDGIPSISAAPAETKPQRTLRTKRDVFDS